MEGKDSDTDEEFKDVLSENEISGKVSEPEYDPPEYDPNPYMGNVILSPAPAPDPAPQGSVVNAEYLEESEEIKKLNERIDGLEEKIRICCPEKEKIKPKIDVKYDYKTRGWARFKESDVDKRHIFHGTLKEMKVKTQELGVAGLVNWIDQRGEWEASPIQDKHQIIHESLIHHIYKWPHTTPGWKPDVLISPGAPLHSIKKKIKEGFVIEFEDPLDAHEMDQLMGVVSGYKNKKRKKKYKRSSKKKKSKRIKRSSKKKKSKRIKRSSKKKKKKSRRIKRSSKRK